MVFYLMILSKNKKLRAISLVFARLDFTAGTGFAFARFSGQK